MSQELWSAVDEYVAETLLKSDDALDAAVKASDDDAGLPSIQVSAPQGKFMYLLAKVHGARRILEIGTLGGYSTIWLARASAGGTLVTMEIDPKHADVASRANVERAGVGDKVEVIVGNARDPAGARG